MSSRLRLLTLARLWLAGALAFSSAFVLAQPVGEVTLMIGAVEYHDASGTRTALKKNQAISANTQITTGPEALVTVRFWDGGSLSVRPGSKVWIKSYSPSTHPRDSEIRFVVETGSARFVSGTQAQQQKDRFRVNTPVAAIGIRGTDFVVTTTDSLSRVMVSKGAIAAAPFDAMCLAAAAGPCNTAKTVELNASLVDSYLEIQPNQTPQILRFKNNHKELFGSGDSGLAQGRMVAGKSLELPLAQALAVTSGENFLWGRSTTAALMPEGYETLGSFKDYVILRKTPTEFDSTSKSFVSLRLKDVDANVILSDGRLEKAQVSGAQLRINLADQSYITKFNWAGGGEKERFFSQGQLTQDGRFSPRQDLSNMNLYGAITADTQEAAYLFSRKVGGVDAVGVLGWRR